MDTPLHSLLFEIEGVLVDARVTRRQPLRDPRGMALVPGARDALAALAGRLRLGVVTRAPVRAATSVLTLAALDDVVACVVGGAPGEPLGADDYERAFARVSMSAGVDRRTCVALVDSPASASAARAAGLAVVGVGRGAHDAASDDPWVESVAALTYDALVQLVATRRMRDS